jgi:hypothetical protein
MYSPSGSGEVHVDQVLTQISIGYKNEALVGDQLFKSVPVKKKSDKYYEFGREGWLPEDDRRAPGAAAREIVGAKVSTHTYYAEEHSLSIAVTDEERENVDSPLAPDRDASELVTDKVLLSRERTIQVLATTAANYHADNTVTLTPATDTWDVYATSDPIGDLRTGKSTVHSKIFREPTLGLFPYQVMTKLEDHPDFLERIKYSERAIFSPDLLAAIIGLGKILVPGTGINNAQLGLPDDIGYLWGVDVVLAYVPPRPGMKIPSYGYEFTQGGQVVDRWRVNERKSDLVRVSRNYDIKMTAIDSSGDQLAGYLIKTAVDVS